jgi:hypothetical protein
MKAGVDNSNASIRILLVIDSTDGGGTLGRFSPGLGLMGYGS